MPFAKFKANKVVVEEVIKLIGMNLQDLFMEPNTFVAMEFAVQEVVPNIATMVDIDIAVVVLVVCTMEFMVCTVELEVYIRQEVDSILVNFVTIVPNMKVFVVAVVQSQAKHKEAKLHKAETYFRPQIQLFILYLMQISFHMDYTLDELECQRFFVHFQLGHYTHSQTLHRYSYFASLLRLQNLHLAEPISALQESNGNLNESHCKQHLLGSSFQCCSDLPCIVFSSYPFLLGCPCAAI